MRPSPIGTRSEKSPGAQGKCYYTKVGEQGLCPSALPGRAVSVTGCPPGPGPFCPVLMRPGVTCVTPPQLSSPIVALRAVRAKHGCARQLNIASRS
jgi:hypothetical protein